MSGPAFWCPSCGKESDVSGACGPCNGKHLSRDMTKRELFAAAAMQGLCVRAHPKYEDGPCDAAIAARAVAVADALLLALEDKR